MFKEHQKVTIGYVTQTYITLPNGTLVCKDQEFIAGDPVDYVDMDGEPIEVDVTKEVYCPLDMKQPKQIPDDKDAVKFHCLACGDDRVEAVMDGSHTTIILGMFKSGSIEYGETESNGDLDRFQCVACGHVITIDDEDPTSNDQQPITDDEQLVEWCKENCNQE